MKLEMALLFRKHEFFEEHHFSLEGRWEDGVPFNWNDFWGLWHGRFRPTPMVLMDYLADVKTFERWGNRRA